MMLLAAMTWSIAQCVRKLQPMLSECMHSACHIAIVTWHDLGRKIQGHVLSEVTGSLERHTNRQQRICDSKHEQR